MKAAVRAGQRAALLVAVTAVLRAAERVDYSVDRKVGC
jgi:hypothetical protein